MYVLLVHTYVRIATYFSLAFSQPATGPSNVTLQCVIVLISDNTTTVQSSAWTRDGTLATTLPNHRLMFNSTTGGFTDLMITSVTLEDDNTVYNCDDTGATITSSVVLNVTGNMYIYSYIHMIMNNTYRCVAIILLVNHEFLKKFCDLI